MEGICEISCCKDERRKGRRRRRRGEAKRGRTCPMERKASPPLEARVSEKYFMAVRMLKFCESIEKEES